MRHAPRPAICAAILAACAGSAAAKEPAGAPARGEARLQEARQSVRARVAVVEAASVALAAPRSRSQPSGRPALVPRGSGQPRPDTTRTIYVQRERGYLVTSLDLH